MLFSVVVPCHNAAPTIGATLASIVAQSLAPHEIIVVNDGSTDDSKAQIAQSGVEVTLIETDFGNAGAARNLGIARARGDWVALCDADDLWFPHHLEQAARVLADGADVADVAYMANHCFLRGDKHEPLPESLRHRSGESCNGTGAQWLDILANGFHFGHSTVIYRRERLLQLGGFNESFERQEDLDLWLRMVAGGTWAYGAQSAMAYRIDTPDSMSKDIVQSEIFYLRALLKNRASYAGETMSDLTAMHARRALSLAFVDGSRAQFRVARRSARPHLSVRLRAFYQLAPLARPLVQSAIRLKRRWVWRGSR